MTEEKIELNIDAILKKDGEYTQVSLSIPAGSGADFFERIKLRLIEETEVIRQDIKSIIGDTNINDINLRRPVVEDKKLQEKVNKLNDARKINLLSITKLNNLLRYNDCIVCDKCKSMMYKTPLYVPFTKMGNSCIIHNVSPNERIEYIYTCSDDNCTYAISESIYLETLRLKNLREELLAKGEKFVPNEFNFWHWEK